MVTFPVHRSGWKGITLEQVLYQSKAVSKLAPDQVFKIVEISARKNPGREITGFLIFAHDAFLQLIEGPSASLDTLLGDIADDPRHTNIEMISRRPIGERHFPTWHMERLSVSNHSVDTVLTKLRTSNLPTGTLNDISNFLQVRAGA